MELALVLSPKSEVRNRWLIDCFACATDRRLNAKLTPDGLSYFYEKGKASHTSEESVSFKISINDGSKRLGTYEVRLGTWKEGDTFGFDLFLWENNREWSPNTAVSRVHSKVTIRRTARVGDAFALKCLFAENEATAEEYGVMTVEKDLSAVVTDNERGKDDAAKARLSAALDLSQRCIDEFESEHPFDTQHFITTRTGSHFYSPCEVETRSCVHAAPIMYPYEFLRNPPKIDAGWFEYYFDAARTIRETRGVIGNDTRDAFHACCLWVQSHYYAKDPHNYTTNDFFSTATNCKDKSCTMMHIVTALMRTKWESRSVVERMQAAVREYVPLIVGGLLLSEDGSELPHSYVFCVHESVFTRGANVRETGRRSYLLDGTVFQSVEYGTSEPQSEKAVRDIERTHEPTTLAVEPLRSPTRVTDLGHHRGIRSYTTVTSLWTWWFKEREKRISPHYAFLPRRRCDECNGSERKWGVLLSELEDGAKFMMTPRVPSFVKESPDAVYPVLAELYVHNRPTPWLRPTEGRPPLSALVPKGMRFSSVAMMHKDAMNDEEIKKDLQEVFGEVRYVVDVSGGSVYIFIP